MWFPHTCLMLLAISYFSSAMAVLPKIDLSIRQAAEGFDPHIVPTSNESFAVNPDPEALATLGQGGMSLLIPPNSSVSLSNRFVEYAVVLVACVHVFAVLAVGV